MIPLRCQRSVTVEYSLLATWVASGGEYGHTTHGCRVRRAGVSRESNTHRVQHGVRAISARLTDQEHSDEDERRRQK